MKQKPFVNFKSSCNSAKLFLCLYYCTGSWLTPSIKDGTPSKRSAWPTPQRLFLERRGLNLDVAKSQIRICPQSCGDMVNWCVVKYFDRNKKQPQDWIDWCWSRKTGVHLRFWATKAPFQPRILKQKGYASCQYQFWMCVKVVEQSVKLLDLQTCAAGSVQLALYKLFITSSSQEVAHPLSNWWHNLTPFWKFQQHPENSCNQSEIDTPLFSCTGTCWNPEIRLQVFHHRVCAPEIQLQSPLVRLNKFQCKSDAWLPTVRFTPRQAFKSSSTRGCWFAMISYNSTKIPNIPVKAATFESDELNTKKQIKKSPPNLLYVEVPLSNALPRSPNKLPHPNQKKSSWQVGWLKRRVTSKLKSVGRRGLLISVGCRFVKKSRAFVELSFTYWGPWHLRELE